MHAEFQASEKLKITLDATGQTDLFNQLADVSEIFSHNSCGACKSPDIRYVVREVAKGTKKHKYYELHCQKCRSKLSFGQHNEGGTLFPHRKDKEGNYLANNGWVKFVKDADKKEETAPSF